MKRKHKIARVRSGLYNYRGTPIRRMKRGWIIPADEEGRVFARGKTRGELCRLVDKIARLEHRHALKG